MLHPPNCPDVIRSPSVPPDASPKTVDGGAAFPFYFVRLNFIRVFSGVEIDRKTNDSKNNKIKFKAEPPTSSSTEIPRDTRIILDAGGGGIFTFFSSLLFFYYFTLVVYVVDEIYIFSSPAPAIGYAQTYFARRSFCVSPC